MSGLAACPACWGRRLTDADLLHAAYAHTTACTWAEPEARQLRQDVALYGLVLPVEREANDVESAMLRALDVDLPRHGRPLITITWPAGGRRHRVLDGVDLDAVETEEVAA